MFRKKKPFLATPPQSRLQLATHVRSSSQTEERIEFIIGRDAKSFMVLRKMMMTQCPYLAGVLETHSGPVRFPDVPPTGFSATIKWMSDRSLPDEIVNSKGVSTVGLQEAYLAALKFKLHEMQNHVMDCTWSLYGRHPQTWTGPRFLTYYSTQNAKDSAAYMFALRSLVFALMNSAYKDDNWKVSLDRLENDGIDSMLAMKDILLYVSKWTRNPWKRPGNDDKCLYHVHLDGKKCEYDPDLDIVLTSGSGSGPGQPESDEGLELEGGTGQQ